MSEARSQKPIRVEDGGFIIEGTPKQTKKAFFKEMEERVRIVDRAEFERKRRGRSVFACLNAKGYKTPWSTGIEDVEILVNKDDFILDGEDFTDLMPIVVRHEIAEFWIYAKKGYSIWSPFKEPSEEQKEAAHRLAIREEYRYAFELGKADRLLQFMKRSHETRADEALAVKMVYKEQALREAFERAVLREKEKRCREDEKAYQKAKARHQRKSRNI